MAVFSFRSFARIAEAQNSGLIRLAILFVVVLFLAQLSAITITIDPSVQYQTIVGFGGQASGNDQQVSEMVNDVGFTVTRIDWCGDTQGNIGDARRWVGAGARTVVGSCWSPPAHWKTNNSLNNGGHLKKEHYDDFANHALAKINEFNDAVNIEMYAISAQNEPDFAQFYSSCIYEKGEDLLDITKRIAARITGAGLSTKVFYHEDMFAAFFGKYFRAFVDDPAGRDAIDALAFHGYHADGVTPANMSSGLLERMDRAARVTYGKELWQTENAGSLGLGYAADVIGTLRYGKVSMYLKYGLVGHSVGMVGKEDEFLYFKGNKTLTYHVCKTIARFIRPGAVQLRSFSSDSSAFTSFVAFNDPAAKALVISLYTDATPRTISIMGPNLPSSFDMWVTNQNTQCVKTGSLSASGIALPANSVITLYGSGFDVAAVSAAPVNRQVVGVGADPGSSVAYYTVQGRRLQQSETGAGHHNAARGVIIRSTSVPGHTTLMLR